MGVNDWMYCYPQHGSNGRVADAWRCIMDTVKLCSDEDGLPSPPALPIAHIRHSSVPAFLGH